VKFTMADDGCAAVTACTFRDQVLEVYGAVGAYTTAGAASAGGLPYRLFGKWGQHPCDVMWDDTYYYSSL
jgi:hypothetical protein